MALGMAFGKMEGMVPTWGRFEGGRQRPRLKLDQRGRTGTTARNLMENQG